MSPMKLFITLPLAPRRELRLVEPFGKAQTLDVCSNIQFHIFLLVNKDYVYTRTPE